jgi:hypothetical protein
MTEKLDKSIWKPYLDHVSKTIATGKQVLIEVASLALGDQIEAEWVPVLGIVYDPKSDLVEVALDDLDHLIHGPREIYAETGPVGLQSLDIIDHNDVHHIVLFKLPLSLPPPKDEQLVKTP